MSLPRHFNTRGIILKKRYFNENDLIITFHSPDLGKIEATAKGARKITSHFTGHLETLNLCNFQLYKSPQRFIITQCQIEKNFKKIRANLKNTFLALLLIEIFEKSSHGQEEHSQILFELVEKTLEILEKDSEKWFLTLETFKLKLLNLLGVLPNITSCFWCTKRWQENNEIWLDREGHLSCSDCKSHLSSQTDKIHFSMIKLIHFILKNTMNSINIVLTDEQKKALSQITRFFFYQYIEKELVSEQIIARMNRPL